MSTTGIDLRSIGLLQAIRNNRATVVELNRHIDRTATIIDFRKDNTTVGSIGTTAGHLTIGHDDVGVRFHSVNNLIYPHNMTTGATPDGTISFGSSGSRFRDLYLSGGVYLGGTGAANKLDDYEFGTWTLGVTIGGSPQTLSGPVATYTKIGNTVSIRLRVGFSKSGSGVVNITGLPFSSSFGSTVSVPIGCQVNSITSTAALFANIDPGTTIVHLADQAGDLTDADFASTAYVYSSFTYQAG
jgi:hypothetical protein